MHKGAPKASNIQALCVGQPTGRLHLKLAPILVHNVLIGWGSKATRNEWASGRVAAWRESEPSKREQKGKNKEAKKGEAKNGHPRTKLDVFQLFQSGRVSLSLTVSLYEK